MDKNLSKSVLPWLDDWLRACPKLSWFRVSFYHVGACAHGWTYLENTWHQNLPWEEGKLVEVFGNVLLESLGPAINADITLTHTNFLCNIANHVLYLMEQVAWWIVSPIREWFRNVWWRTTTIFRCFVTSKFPRSQSSKTFAGFAGQGQSMEAPPDNLQHLKDLL